VSTKGHTQVDDVIAEVKDVAKKGYRSLVTVLTKRMAEDLTEYMHEQGVRVRYMHSDIDTVERIEIIRDLRLGVFDVLIGINLSARRPRHSRMRARRHSRRRQGRLPALETSLVQTIGRAARNVDGKVILYADKVTGSMERAMAETARRREKQEAYNLEHGITPQTIKRGIQDIMGSVADRDSLTIDPRDPMALASRQGAAKAGDTSTPFIGHNIKSYIADLEKQMRDAASNLEFEEAGRIRDEIRRLQETELLIADDPLARQSDVSASAEDGVRAARGKGMPAEGEERRV
jgi:excinuclease ABC subunit B